MDQCVKIITVKGLLTREKDKPYDLIVTECITDDNKIKILKYQGMYDLTNYIGMYLKKNDFKYKRMKINYIYSNDIMDVIYPLRSFDLNKSKSDIFHTKTIVCSNSYDFRKQFNLIYPNDGYKQIYTYMEIYIYK